MDSVSDRFRAAGWAPNMASAYREDNPGFASTFIETVDLDPQKSSISPIMTERNRSEEVYVANQVPWSIYLD